MKDTWTRVASDMHCFHSVTLILYMGGHKGVVGDLITILIVYPWQHR